MSISKNVRYGYHAGWMDAREMIYDAIKAERDPTAQAALEALVNSMGTEVRQDKADAYAREVESSDALRR